MLTIFSTPRPFEGIFNTIQKNALRNWMQLMPDAEIILIEDEEGTTSEVAKTFGLKCLTDIKKNENGSLYLDDVFQKIREISRHKILAHINTDILLLPGFMETILSIPHKRFYITGQRWNLDITDEIDFSQSQWADILRNKIKGEGVRHPPTGMDYWVFPKAFHPFMPRFIVGRPAVDSWFIQEARRAHIPTIDATSLIDIIHQNHPRKHGADLYEIETAYNRKLSKMHSRDNRNYYFTLDDTDYLLTSKGLEKKKMNLRKVLRYRSDRDVLKGPSFFWKIFFSGIKPALWVHSRMKRRA